MNTPKKEWKKLYPIVEPLVEKMRAKYPPELNIEGFEPALTQDIVEIVDSVNTSRDEALVAGLEGMKKKCGWMPLGFNNDPYNKTLDEAIALIRGSKEEDMEIECNNKRMCGSECKGMCYNAGNADEGQYED